MVVIVLLLCVQLSELVDEEAEKAALMAKLDDLETRKARIDQLLTQLRTLQSTGKCLCRSVCSCPTAHNF